MRKIITCSLACLLTACTPKSPPPRPTPDTVASTVLFDAAPLSWVQILPSERAADFKEIDFRYISKQIRFWMLPFREKFGKVTLVLVDYTILPARKVAASSVEVGGVKYCKDFVPAPARYFLNISFYEGNSRPPARASFTGTVTMSVFAAPTYETIHFMVGALMEEHVYSSLKSRIVIQLDQPNGTLTGIPTLKPLGQHVEPRPLRGEGHPHHHKKHHPHHLAPLPEKAPPHPDDEKHLGDEHRA